MIIIITRINCQIVRSRSLRQHRINYKFMPQSAYRERKLADQRARTFSGFPKIPDWTDRRLDAVNENDGNEANSRLRSVQQNTKLRFITGRFFSSIYVEC